MAPRSRRPSKDSIKAAADRAEARAKGETVDAAPAEPSALNPPQAAPTPIEKPKGRDEAGRFAKGWKGGGRRSTYSAPIGKAICKMLAKGMTLNEISSRRLMPPESTVRLWASNPQHPFAAKYTQAREIGYLKMADDLVDIADDGSNDWMERKQGDQTVTVADHEHISRSKLRIETRKWLLSKALPKVFGDKTSHEVSGPDGGPIETKETSDLEAARKVAFMLGRAVGRQEKASDDAPAG
jgi:hypothetical protein